MKLIRVEMLENTRVMRVFGNRIVGSPRVRTLSFRGVCDTFRIVFCLSAGGTVWALFLTINSTNKSL
jgi:hypothetical protein